MNKTDCAKEKLSSRMVGFIILPFALILAFVGFLIVPVVGLLFAVPPLLLAVVFIAAPESRVCRLLTPSR